MEYGSIERELYIEAAPDVVYHVITAPEHLREWWPDDASLDPVPGAAGTISFGVSGSPEAVTVPLTVVEADPPRRFSFRWAYDASTADEANSLLVVFELMPSGLGTLLRFRETGFRERGWEAAVLEETYRDHARGWDGFLPRLVARAEKLVSGR